ncbi:MAG TPA: hypothetical protein VMT72_10405 [Pseudolabrys sp.]|nr:hypothetical protein [Pseudolabrys sp.]
MAWTKTDDDSIVDDSGKVIYFSTQRFIKDIALGNCCFICGAAPDTKPFNDEHVFPKWLLQRYGLFARTITLPNGRPVRYDRHTVPCCEQCNTLMGRRIEQPMSRALDGSPHAVQDFVASGGGLELFVWMGLIYLKLHLKNKTNRKVLDPRVDAGMIADDYDWYLLHHLHTVIRCFYADTVIEPEVFGSLMVYPVRVEGSLDEFDFGDLHATQTMMLRLGRTAIFVVFDDSKGAQSYIQHTMYPRLTGPISELQAREIMVEFAMLNFHLKDRPIYQSLCDTEKEEHTIIARLSEKPELDGWDLDARGQLMWDAIGHAWSTFPSLGSTEEEVKRAVLTGKISVLWDDNGNFILGDAKAWK